MFRFSLTRYMVFLSNIFCNLFLILIGKMKNISSNKIQKIKIKLPLRYLHKMASIFQNELDGIVVDSSANKTIEKTRRIKQLNFLDLFDQYSDNPIVENCMVHEDIDIEYGNIHTHRQLSIDSTKNVLICNVKKDNWEQFLDGSTKIYYTGKKFPTTVALNKLYYFMPYISGKGIRDLYYIKTARLGYRKEGQENEDKSDLRLVFEIERVGQLFDDYKKVKLEIWRTFTDTTLNTIIEE